MQYDEILTYAKVRKSIWLFRAVANTTYNTTQRTVIGRRIMASFHFIDMRVEAGKFFFNDHKKNERHIFTRGLFTNLKKKYFTLYLHIRINIYLKLVNILRYVTSINKWRQCRHPFLFRIECLCWLPYHCRKVIVIVYLRLAKDDHLFEESVDDLCMCLFDKNK